MLSRSQIRAFAGMVALVVLSGCGATPMATRLIASPPPGLPASAEVADVPFFPQTRFYCGPAALATVLNTTGLDTVPDELARSVYTPGREGTLQTEILTGARRQGRLALPLRTLDDAAKTVFEGRPVLVLQNLALSIAPQWHYAVIIGYDLSAETITLRSGTTSRLVMPMTTFEHTWRRSGYWGVVVVGPDGPVPDHTTLSEWLGEAYGLERAGHAPEALTAYIVAARHWPKASAPLISAANILTGADKLQAAKTRLQTALQRQPEDPVALNNLADVLMRLGELEAAERAALKAVDAGGETQATAKQTLAEIQAQKYNVQK